MRTIKRLIKGELTNNERYLLAKTTFMNTKIGQAKEKEEFKLAIDNLFLRIENKKLETRFTFLR